MLEVEMMKFTFITTVQINISKNIKKQCHYSKLFSRKYLLVANYYLELRKTVNMYQENS